MPVAIYADLFVWHVCALCRLPGFDEPAHVHVVASEGPCYVYCECGAVANKH